MLTHISIYSMKSCAFIQALVSCIWSINFKSIIELTEIKQKAFVFFLSYLD